MHAAMLGILEERSGRLPCALASGAKRPTPADRTQRPTRGSDRTSLTPRRRSGRSDRRIKQPVANAVLTIVVDIRSRSWTPRCLSRSSGLFRWSSADSRGPENPSENRMSTLGLPSRLEGVRLSERCPLHAYLLRGCCADVRGALPNLAVLDQGGACGAASGAPRAGLRPWRPRPARPRHVLAVPLI